MKYKGSILKKFVQENRGKYTEICVAMLGGKKKGLDNYYHDGRNLQLNKLTQLLKATGKPIDFFVEFEPGELPAGGGIVGNNNFVNSIVGNDMSLRLDHLNEVLELKDQLLKEKERVIAMKDAEIANLKKEKLQSESDKTRT